jgi:hypothetical protein
MNGMTCLEAPLLYGEKPSDNNIDIFGVTAPLQPLSSPETLRHAIQSG